MSFARQGIHNAVQDFVQNSILDWLHKANKSSNNHKRFRWVFEILVKLRKSVVDWKDGYSEDKDYLEKKKARAEIKHDVKKREVRHSVTSDDCSCHLPHLEHCLCRSPHLTPSYS